MPSKCRSRSSRRSGVETTAAYGDTVGRATERLALPAGAARDAGGLSVELASTALVGLGEGARYVTDYPHDFAEVRASRALTLLLASDLGAAFRLSTIKADDYRTEAQAVLQGLYAFQCPDGGFRVRVDRPCIGRCPGYLTAYVLHVLHVADTLDVAVDRDAVARGLSFLQQELRQPPPEVQWWPVWGASHAFAVKVLSEHGRNPSADITRLVEAAERLPILSLSHLADALASTADRGTRYQDVTRRLMNAIRIDADRAHVEEVDDAVLRGLWNSNTRATAVVLDGIARRKDDPALVVPLVRWLLSVRTDGRWMTTHENAMALEALVAYYRTFESGTPQMTSAVTLGAATIGSAAFKGRSTASQHIAALDAGAAEARRIGRPSFADDCERGHRPRVLHRSGADIRARAAAGGEPRLPRRAAVRAVPAGGHVASDDDLQRGRPGARRRDRGASWRGSLRRPHRSAGRRFEPLDAQFQTTASDLARRAILTTTSNDPWAQWRRGLFDHVEKRDDRVIAFATRLGTGRHEFSYLVRATTAGSFGVAGARMEAMYAPEVTGRSAATTITIR